MLVDKIRLCYEPWSLIRRVGAPVLAFFFIATFIVCMITILVLLGRSANAYGFCDAGLVAFAIFSLVFFALEAIGMGVLAAVAAGRGTKDGGNNEGSKKPYETVT